MPTVRKATPAAKSKKTTQKKINLEEKSFMVDRIKIGSLIVVGVFAIFLLLSLFTYHASDPGWSTTGTANAVQNSGGAIGAYLADIMLSWFGFFGFVIPLLLVYGLWIIYVENSSFAERSIFLTVLRCLGVLLNFAAGSALCQVALEGVKNNMPQGSGGMVGHFIATYMVQYLNFPGAVLILIALFCIGLTLYSGGAWIKMLIKFGVLIGVGIQSGLAPIGRNWKRSREKAKEQAELHKIEKAEAKALREEEALLNQDEVIIEETNEEPTPFDMEEALTEEQYQEDLGHLDDQEFLEPKLEQNAGPIEPSIGLGDMHSDNMQPSVNEIFPHQEAHDEIEAPAFDAPIPSLPEFEEMPLSSKAIEEPQVTAPAKKSVAKPKKHDAINGLPSLDLLDNPGEKPETVSKDVLDKMGKLVENKLADFGVKTTVVAVHPGPVITRFELELAPGIKVSKLTALSQDLARSLSTTRVRVVEVIPGKPYVGIELPNQNREMVRIKEILSHPKFIESKSALTIALGKGIAGEAEIANIGKMPHLLVAGTTGSGKSVGVNAMIISMLYKAGPVDLRMIMIDPKMLELSIYEGIPHLLTPVVTDMKEASNALRWCVKEMDQRYELMAAMGVRNIDGLNEKIKEAQEKGEPLKDPIWIKLRPGHDADAPDLEKMPYIVVIADEFADMMMVVGKKVEELIARLAQKARASGIHLILATQRPSVDVVTGLIKANIPTRLSFQVSSRIDSRTIIDQQGAEQLLGHGDMLYVPPGTGMPIRVHGAFVDDDEVHRVVAAWKEIGGEADYIDSILATVEEGTEAGDGNSAGGEKDALYDEAVNIVLESQRASISSVQRRLRIGYNRAARLIEEMESAGVVSEMQSNGMREVLVRKGV